MAEGIVYCSGPFYNLEEMESMADFAMLLGKNNYQAFLPQRDGIEAFYLKAKKQYCFDKKTEDAIQRAVFALDVYQIIERCDCLVLNMNGRTPEEGSVFKAGLAYAAGKPVVIYKNDNRSAFHGNDNGMVIGLTHSFLTVSKFGNIPKELEKAKKCMAKAGTNPYLKNAPPAVRLIIDQGKQIWNALEGNQFWKKREEDYPKCIEHLAGLCKDILPVMNSSIKIDTGKRKAYCSGPLFCPEEIGVMSDIASALENSGYNTYLPHRDGVEAFVMNAVDNPITSASIFRPFNRLANKIVFALDIYQIVDKCHSFVFNMNGRVPDEGGVVETAVAFASGMPVVIYKSDERSVFSGQNSSVFLNFPEVNVIKDIPDKMREAEKHIARLGRYSYREHIPPQVLKAVRLGSRVQKVLNILQLFKPKNLLLKRKKW
jgi:nucleoside 2-deoxyribosyltransferase